MPNYSDDQRALHMSYVRRIMMIKGEGLENRGQTVAVTEIVNQLRENGLMLEWRYVDKLKRKVLAERIKNVNAYTRELLRKDLARALTAHLETAYSIIHSNKSKSSDKISAMTELRMTYCAIYDRTIDLQSFEDNMKTLVPQSDATYQISEPKLIAVVDAMVRFNLLPKQINGNPIESRPDAGNAPSGVTESVGA